MRSRLATFLIVVRLLFFFLIVVILVVIIVKLWILIVVDLLKCKSLASEPVNSAWNEFLLDVFTKLIVELKSLLNIRGNIIFFIWGSRRREEVEEGLRRYSLLNNTRLFGVCTTVSS